MAQTKKIVPSYSAKIHVLTPDDLDRGHREYFWSKGVNMDDWDYMVIAPADMISPSHREEVNFRSTERVLEKLFGDRYNNVVWYKIDFGWGRRAVGVTYHA